MRVKRSLSLATALLLLVTALCCQSLTVSAELAGATAETAYLASEALAKAELTDYTAGENSVKIKWKSVSGADGYTVYHVVGKDAYKLADITGKTETEIKGLEAGAEYKFAVRAYSVSGGVKTKGAISKVLTVYTTPSKSGTKLLSVGFQENKVVLKWEKANCTGYKIFAVYGSNWIKVRTITNSETTSTVFDYDKLFDEYINEGGYVDPFLYFFYDDPTMLGYGVGQTASGSKKYAALFNQGGAKGYRFAIKTYTEREGSDTFQSDLFTMKEPIYNMAELKSIAGSSDVKLIEKVLKANQTGKQRTKYTLCYTSTDSSGKISTTTREATISSASLKAIETFAKKHFKSSWSDAEKLIFTINWINKNVDYDYEYKSPGGGYSDNIYTYKTGQCDSYNGAIAELLTYLGYKNVILQSMDSSVRHSPHTRAAIYYDGNYYTFETGNYGKNGSWMWYINEGLEVPLKS